MANTVMKTEKYDFPNKCKGRIYYNSDNSTRIYWVVVPEAVHNKRYKYTDNIVEIEVRFIKPSKYVYAISDTLRPGQFEAKGKNNIYSYKISLRQKSVVPNKRTDLIYRKKAEENTSLEIVESGTTVNVGLGEHQCKGKMSGSLLKTNKCLIDKKGKPQHITVYQCVRCGKLFVSEEDYAKYGKGISNYVIKLNFDLIHLITPKMIMTRVNVFSCSSQDHMLIDIICKINVLTYSGQLKVLEIPAAYCMNCKKYFILESEYQLAKKEGIIVCKIVKKAYWNNKIDFDDYNLHDESLLHILGYNVNAQDDIPKQQRWRLLEILVDGEILTKVEICSHLDYLINRSKNRKNFENACRKWNEDRDHISNYRNQELLKVEADSIVVKEKKSK